jgi:hypothetical protein
VEILRVIAIIALQDLTGLEHYENLKEAHLRWLRDPVEEVLPILKRCTNLRRLTLASLKRLTIPSSEEFCDFIMELKHLTFLHIICCGNLDCNHFKSLLDEVKAFVLPRRPNFKIYISCCLDFSEYRVRS